MQDLGGTTAVITGAASGIGHALTRALAAEGVRVLAVDVDDVGLKDTTDGLADTSFVTCDVSDADAVTEMADTAFDRLGHVDLLANNAGVFQGGLAWETTTDDWNWVLGVNLHGVIHGLQAFVPRMIEQGTEAHIVNTASMAAHTTVPLSGAYSATKAAVQALTESLAHDLAMVESQVHAHCLVPSLIATNIGTSHRNRPETVTPHFSDMRSFVDEALKDSTARGLSPDQAAQSVITAIKDNQFLIPTKDSYRDQIQARAASLVDRQLPNLSVID